MKAINPLSIKRVLKKNEIIFLIIYVIMLSAIGTYNYCIDVYHKSIFNKISVTFKEVKAIEYGTLNYDPMSLVEDVKYGSIVKYTNDIDTTSLGKQTLNFVVREKNVTKLVQVDAVVVDTESPVININNETVEVMEDSEYNVYDNISSVIDNVSGELSSLNEENKDGGYYTVDTSLDTVNPGVYVVNVNAVDESGNTSSRSFNVNVVEKPRPQAVVETHEYYSDYSDVSASVDQSSVVSAAMSFNGYPYVYGGSSPSGFDCSGFVYYIYGLFGKSVGRTTSGLLGTGYSVSRDSMQPGDIILWSDNGYSPTHAAIYTGGDSMIHAANSRDGVIISSISSWERYAGKIYSIRRV